VQALPTSRPRLVRVGLVNDRVFLVNAGVGLYPERLQDREARKQPYGRNRGVVVLAAVATLLRQHRPLRIVLMGLGGDRLVRTTTLFVGNNRLQLEQIGLATGDDSDAARLAAVVVRPIGVRGLLGLALRGALGELGSSANVRRCTVERWDCDAAGRGFVRVSVHALDLDPVPGAA
jgi:diacylglycerol kinase family enzyme